MTKELPGCSRAFQQAGGADVVGSYRYRLWRSFPEARGDARVLFVMLNPSTADGATDDPTLRRCLGFARRWGFARLDVCNLFAFRSTDPAALRTMRDPVGPRNDRILRAAAARAHLTIVAWGNGGQLHQRGAYVASSLLAEIPLYCLGRTRGGEPRHPLYVAGATARIRYL
jgi:hypothetical protein